MGKSENHFNLVKKGMVSSNDWKLKPGKLKLEKGSFFF